MGTAHEITPVTMALTRALRKAGSTDASMRDSPKTTRTHPMTSTRRSNPLILSARDVMRNPAAMR